MADDEECAGVVVGETGAPLVEGFAGDAVVFGCVLGKWEVGGGAGESGEEG
jgi:hypothetical protein